MEFLKDRVFTALNADELRAGDKVIVADCMADLKEFMNDKGNVVTLEGVSNELCNERFRVEGVGYLLAYLVERAENCTNCACHCEVTAHPELDRCSNWKPKTDTKVHLCQNCVYAYPECPAKVSDCEFGNGVGNDNIYKCKVFKPKTEKHYRPFANTDELIKVWEQKFGKVLVKGIELTMPFIWVRRDSTSERCLIVSYTNDSVYLGHRAVSLYELWEHFTFLDGSTCGVEE